MKQILPPALFAGTAAAMTAASLLIPGPVLVAGPPRLAGIALGVLGAMATVGGSTQFQRVGTNIKSFADPDHLVTDGLFAWSRNPMYLGFVGMLAGLGVGLGTTTPWLGPLVFLITMDRVYVRFEEIRMQAVFGSEFDRYCSRVGRWFGRRPIGDRTVEQQHVG